MATIGGASRQPGRPARSAQATGSSEAEGHELALLDSAGRIRLLEPGLAAAGRDAAALPGRPLWDLAAPDGAHKLRAALDELARTGEPQQHHASWLRTDGSARPMHWEHTPLQDAQGRHRYVLSAARDAQAPADAPPPPGDADSVTAAPQAADVSGLLATELVHELSQPLTAIAATAYSGRNRLRADDAAPSMLTPAFERIVQQSQRAGEILAAIRILLREGERPLDAAGVHSLNKPLKTALAQLSPELATRGVAVTTALEPALPPTRLHSVQMAQALRLMLRHTLAVQPDVSRLHVRTGRTADGRAEGEVRLDSAATSGTVPGSDTTEAHPDEDAHRTLALCRAVIVAHGGALVAESPSGGGVILRFSLPAAGDRA